MIRKLFISPEIRQTWYHTAKHLLNTQTSPLICTNTLSPSGTGLRCFSCGTIPRHGHKLQQCQDFNFKTDQTDCGPGEVCLSYSLDHHQGIVSDYWYTLNQFRNINFKFVIYIFLFQGLTQFVGVSQLMKHFIILQ